MSKPRENLREFDGAFLVAVPDAKERDPLARQHDAGRELRLGVRFAEGAADTHDLAGGFHLRAQDGVRAREFHEREHRLLDRIIRRNPLVDEALLLQGFAHHNTGGDARERDADGLGDERHRARCAGIYLQQVDHVVLDGELDVHEADDIEALRQARGR